MTFGVIARADEGGLGVQTWEYVRHLDPDIVLLVDVDPPRGEFTPSRYSDHPEVRHVHVPLVDDEFETWKAFAADCDTILTAETFYRPGFNDLCDVLDTRLVVHANAELWEWGRRPNFEVWSPTHWLDEQFMPPTTRVIPMPVDRERCKWRDIREVKTLLHPSAPAMEDRNGTHLVIEALSKVQSKVTLLVSGPERPPEEVKIGSVTVKPVDPVRDYWTAYDDADALVLPRRYGGLCLPMQEAAACGLPIVTLDVEPQNDWLPGVQAQPGKTISTKGGPVITKLCSDWDLARAIDAVVDDPALLIGQSRRWSKAIGWDTPLGDEWRQRLGC